MRAAAMALLCALALLGAGTGRAAAEGDCGTHLVTQGDTLTRLAMRYYDDPYAADRLWRANRDAVGRNPNLLVPGTVLTIPCPHAAESAAAEHAPPPDPQTEAAVVSRASTAPAMDTAPADPAAQPQQHAAAEHPPAAPAPAEEARAMPAAIHILAGGPYRPFVDGAAPDKGLIPALITAAFAATDGPPPRIGVVDDRPAHLSVIMPRGGFALGAPWVYPDCAAPPENERAARLCADYVASDSLYEHVTEFFARADSRWADAVIPGQLEGARICRPAGYPDDDLHAMGLLPDRAERVALDSPETCLEALDLGEVDIASLDATLGRALVARMPLQNPLVVLDTITRVERLRAVARRDDPAGEAALARLNLGLARIVETGAWIDIVRAHLVSPES